MKNNYTEQQYRTEELLAIAAANLELDETRKQQMISAYKAVNDVFDKDEDFFKDYTVNVYAQGSLLIGTTIKPLPGKEFDLDIVLKVVDSFSNHTPKEIYDEVYRVLDKHGNYSSLLQKKNRCIRINYNSDFHMDILSGCKITSENTRVMIPNDKTLKDWSRTDPKGYATWFEKISEKHKSQFMLNQRFIMLSEAKVETEDLPTDVYVKSPVQRTVQIVKRYRDLYYQNKDLSKTPAISSIVLTTLIAQSYDEELSIQEALKNAIVKMKRLADNYRLKGIRFQVYNPVDLYSDKESRENFTDSWTDKHYNSFVGFVDDLEKKINAFIHNPKNEENYKDLFGNGYYKQNIQTLIRLDEAIKGKPQLAAILAGTARTDASGNINTTSGVKNGKHGFFAES
ncbi:nucleotidyltransferase [Empedobacter falsenii]|uniref:nucleotidyltransferase domain-containing protein n=1 Tax=Empedobacter falsenii TaxID=343874 RepID=UPI002576E990|nr:nucleotidyltransferase [Empedobacter falsenii]MDM1063622.1 nucleotidyltransferase [Empedobacter falsenii]